MANRILFIALALALGWCGRDGARVHAQAPGMMSLDAPALANFCTGATLYGSAQQADMEDFAAPFNQLLYAQRWSCAIPVACSLCNVTIGFIENRSGLDPTSPIGPGRRVFTVAFNGMVSDPIDLFKAAGPRMPVRKTWRVAGFDGILRLTFQTQVAGMNAIASLIEISEAAAPAPKFVTDTFPMNDGTPVGDQGSVAFTLSKTPVPDSGMFVSFTGDPAWWQSVVIFLRPDTSKTVNLSPPNFSGRLQIAYWSFD